MRMGENMAETETNKEGLFNKDGLLKLEIVVEHLQTTGEVEGVENGVKKTFKIDDICIVRCTNLLTGNGIRRLGATRNATVLTTVKEMLEIIG